MGKPDYDLKRAISTNRLVGLWRLMHGFRLDYLGATVMQGLSAYAKTATYLLLSAFVDSFLIARTSRFPLWGFALAFIILAAFQGIFTFLSGKLAARTAEGTILRLRNYLFDHIQHLSYAYHAESDTGELIQRCTSDVDALRRFYNDQAIGVGRILLLFAVNLVALIQLNTRLALLSVIVVPLVIAVSLYFFRLVSKAYEAYQEQDAVLSTILQENLSGVRVVKAFSRQPYEMEKFDRDNWQKYKLGKKLLIMHSLFWPITDILCGAQLLGGLLLGAMMAIDGQITIGNYLAYAGLIVWIIYPLRGLGRLIVQMSNGMVSYDRVFKIIRENRERLDDGSFQPASPIQGEIIFDHVSFEYEQDDRVLHDISFKVDAGQVVALLGSTGSGKTTLVNLLPRFYDCTSGHILLDGVDLKSYSRRFLRQQIGIVEQEPFLFSRSIRENITYGVERDVSQEEVEKVARMAAIHDSILGFPEGYRTLVGERGVTLSGGQKQRIAIARTLLKDPRILILDDSTSSVDTETEIEIRQAMESLMVGRTTFIIAHRIQSIMSAALILVMGDGRILQQGSHDTLISQEGMYKQIYEIQTRIESELEKEIASAR
jgi:ATP-binding cassette subfamily B protein